MFKCNFDRGQMVVGLNVHAKWKVPPKLKTDFFYVRGKGEGEGGGWLNTGGGGERINE